MQMPEIRFHESSTLPGCCHGECNADISEAVLKLVPDGTSEIELKCAAGHISRIKLTASKSEAVNTPTPPAPSTVRTKVSGVTFDNADGTSRQTLLRHIRPGEEVSVKKGKDNAFYVKHALGVIGVVKRELIAFMFDDASVPEESIELHGKVIQVTGGSEDKPTYGCNIEIVGAPASTAANEPVNAEPKQKAPLVFMDPEGRNIFHSNKFCSGMQNAKPVSLKHARNVRARPCKRCAGKYLPPQKGS